MRVWIGLCENIQNDESWEFVRVTQDITGLSFDIYLDDNSAFKNYSHVLWLYIDYNGSKIPVTVEDEPKIGFVNPNGIFDLTNLFDFIRKNLNAITNLAECKIDYEIFLRIVKPVDSNSFSMVPTFSYINEMATLRPDKSKLPTIIWLDDDKLYLPHSPRIKFRADFQNNDTHFGPTMEIHNPDNIHNLKKCDLTTKEIDLLKMFVRTNEEILRQLADKEINLQTFLNKMKTVGENWEVIESEKPVIGKFVYGFAIYKIGNKYNFLKEDGSFLFNSPIFDNVTNFQKFNDGNVYAYVKLGDELYYIDTNGNKVNI